jgi:PAS domain S-box-containing protein
MQAIATDPVIATAPISLRPDRFRGRIGLAIRRPGQLGLPLVTGALAVLVGLIVLSGWALQVRLLTTIVPQAVAMKPNSAVAFVLIGSSLIVLGRPGGRLARRVGIGLALAGATIGVATIIEYVSGRDLGIDQILFRTVADSGGQPGRMAPLSAICFSLIGSAVALAAVGRAARPVIIVATAAILISAVNLFKFLFAAAAPSFLAGYTEMAVHTAVAIALVGFGAIGLLGARSPLLALTGRSATAVVSRRLLAVCIGTPIILAWLRLAGEANGWYDTAFGTSLMLVVTIAVIVVAIVRSASWAAELELRRERADIERDSFFEMSLDMLIVMGREGVFKRVNRAWVATFGYPAGEVEGHLWTEFIHPDDLGRTTAEASRNLVDGEDAVAFANRYRCKDGSYRWLEWMSQVGPDGSVRSPSPGT